MKTSDVLKILYNFLTELLSEEIHPQDNVNVINCTKQSQAMNNKTDDNIEKEKGPKSKVKTEDGVQPHDEAGEEAEEEAWEDEEEVGEEVGEEPGEEVGEEFGLVSNIPPSWHTSDLRRHFMDWVEGGLFTTFHFRHRPEKGATADWSSH